MIIPVRPRHGIPGSALGSPLAVPFQPPGVVTWGQDANRTGGPKDMGACTLTMFLCAVESIGWTQLTPAEKRPMENQGRDSVD